VATEWQLSTRGIACDACQRAFNPGEPFDAFLFDGAQGYERRDLCPACVTDEAARAIGHWKTRRAPSSAPPRRAFDVDAACELLAQLESAQTPEALQLRFVLALLSWRKKALRLERVEGAADGERWVFASPRDERPVIVRKPELHEQDLERLGTQLDRLLLAGAAGPADDSPVPEAANG